MPVPPSEPDMHLVLAHHHCHAPTCEPAHAIHAFVWARPMIQPLPRHPPGLSGLAMEIWNNETGKLVCRQTPIYGGTGDETIGDKFDEPGYILTPPCLWGEDPALEPMPLASGVRFMIKAITNSTYTHHGEMAFPEVTLVPVSCSLLLSDTADCENIGQDERLLKMGNWRLAPAVEEHVRLRKALSS